MRKFQIYSWLQSLILLLFVGVVVSCSSPEEAPPIPEEELKNIITDALLLESAGRELSDQIQDSIATIYYEKILTERGYKMEEFIAAMAWLQKDPERLAILYNEVMEKLTVIESEKK